MSSTIQGRSTTFAKPNEELHVYHFKDGLKMCLERAFKPHRSSTTEPRGHDVLSYLCDKLARHGCAPEQTSDHHQNRFRSNRLPVTTLRQGRAEYAPIWAANTSNITAGVDCQKRALRGFAKKKSSIYSCWKWLNIPVSCIPYTNLHLGKLTHPFLFPLLIYIVYQKNSQWCMSCDENQSLHEFWCSNYEDAFIANDLFYSHCKSISPEDFSCYLTNSDH